jgi:hypothetical protein
METQVESEMTFTCTAYKFFEPMKIRYENAGWPTADFPSIIVNFMKEA